MWKASVVGPDEEVTGMSAFPGQQVLIQLVLMKQTMTKKMKRSPMKKIKTIDDGQAVRSQILLLLFTLVASFGYLRRVNGRGL